MIVTASKITYQKIGPTVINYRDYKNFSELKFMRELKEEMDGFTTSDIDYSSLQNIFGEVRDKHALVKRTCARANDRPFMNRVLRKIFRKEKRTLIN